MLDGGHISNESWDLGNLFCCCDTYLGREGSLPSAAARSIVYAFKTQVRIDDARPLMVGSLLESLVDIRRTLPR